jgi:hypothetical protein
MLAIPIMFEYNRDRSKVVASTVKTWAIVVTAIEAVRSGDSEDREIVVTIVAVVVTIGS